MGSIIGHRIDCNGVWALRGQQHMPGAGGPGGGRGGKDRNLLLIVNIQFKVNNIWTRIENLSQKVSSST